MENRAEKLCRSESQRMQGAQLERKRSWSSRYSNLSQLFIEEPVSAAELAAISSGHVKAGWVSQMVVKIMHQWKATPRTIDRFCRHIYSAAIAIVGALMLNKIPPGRTVSSPSFNIASERTLLLPIVIVLGTSLLVGAFSMCIALFRCSHLGIVGNVDSQANTATCDENHLLPERKRDHDHVDPDVHVLVEKTSTQDALRETAGAAAGSDCAQLSGETDDRRVGESGTHTEETARHRPSSDLEKSKKQLCCMFFAS